MKNTKNKIKIITIMAFLVAILSIGVGYSSYNTTNEISGKATIIENLCDIKIDNIKDVNTSLETITFKDTPSIISNTINFSITSMVPNNNISFKFDLYNEGILPVKIKNITLKGIDKYQEYLEYSISNIAINDVIKGETKLLDNTFTLNYKEVLKDEYGNPLNINLDNLSLVIDFEQIKE